MNSPEQSPTRVTGGRRRNRTPWTLDEVELLIAGVKKFGKGNWSVIGLQMGFGAKRTPTDLKDKWRSLSEKRSKSRVPQSLKKIVSEINHDQDQKENTSQMSDELREFLKKVTVENAQELAMELLKLKGEIGEFQAS